VEIRFNPDDMTLGDMDDFEQAAGMPLDEAVRARPVLDEDGKRVVDEDGRPVTEARMSAKVMIALVWITQRRQDPAFTLAAARNVRVSSIKLSGRDEQTPAEVREQGKDESA
jgi:hypothetical protein